MNSIDISMRLGAHLPVWPASPGLAVERRLSLERGNEANVAISPEGARRGRHLLACLPLRLDGVEAAPARAILLPAPGVTP